MIDDLNFGRPRYVLAGRPNLVAAANGYREDRNSGLKCQSNSASLETVQLPVRLAPARLREISRRFAPPQPLQRSPDSRRITAFDLQRPGAKQAE